MGAWYISSMKTKAAKKSTVAPDDQNKVWDINALIVRLDGIKGQTAVTEFAKLIGKFIGSGIHRDAYVVKTTKFSVVLKVARQEYAMTSNRSEIQVSHSYRKSPVLSKIYAHAKDGAWIIAEFISEETNMGKIAAFFSLKIDADQGNMRCSDLRLTRNITEIASVQNHPWIMEYKKLLANEKVADLHEGNWRMRESGEPVIVDYGFSRHGR